MKKQFDITLNCNNDIDGWNGQSGHCGQISKKILTYNLTLSKYSLKKVKLKISIILLKIIQEIVGYFQKMDRLDILDRLEN